ncbi:MAG: laminin sub domain 2 [Thermoleophilia bacterium]|nr:laminin sub domain 2 [Thermoleophilia bacterium]
MTARTLLFLLATLIVGGSITSLASAYWTGFEEQAAGMSTAHATTINTGPKPRVSVDNASTATVTWAPSSAADGSQVDGYRVARYDSETHALQSIGPGCSGVLATNTCTELAVPLGSWTYAVTPTLGTNWRGAEGPESALVVVSPKTLTLAQYVFGASLPATTTGTLTGFLPNEPVTFELDGQPISGEPAQVDGSGAAAITSLAIPAGTADGWHDVVAVGHATPAPSRAVASVLVDSVAPTFTTATIPTPNAAGWNNTSPVEVKPIYGDGAGSGLAAVMYTTDGTDPKFSPTVQMATGPRTVAATETQRSYAVDVAGNATATRTHEVKIDTQDPTYTSLPNVIEGGAYLGMLGLYYRGVDAGRITVSTTVVDGPGGSGAAYAATPALTGLATGFTHVASAVSTPEGGPYESNQISWVAGSSSDPSTTLSVADRAGNVASRQLALFNDSAPPIGGAVGVTGLAGADGRYATSQDLAVELTPGVDALSGLAGVGAQLLRATAPLEAGSCTTYGSYAQVGPDDPASSLVDTVPSDQACYRFRYRVQDHVGNWATYESPDIKVGVVAPSTLQPSGVAITPVSGVRSQHVSGMTIYINPSASGSFRVEADASDPASGVQHLAFPAMLGLKGGGAVSSAFAPSRYQATYAWVALSPAVSPGVQALTATNRAGRLMTNASAFTVRVDGAGPTGGAVTTPELVDGIHSATTTVQLTLAPGHDGGAGVAASEARLWRASAALSSAEGCGAFGSYTEIAGVGSSTSLADIVPAGSTCYRYAYHAVDNVGNVTVYSSGDIEVGPV